MTELYNLPHRFASRATKYKWLSPIDDLSLFYWAVQPHVPQGLSLWLRAWYRNCVEDYIPDSTMLFLWGQNGTGKSVVAKGIAKYHLLNLGCPTLECIPWSAYVDDQLNGAEMEVNWKARLLIVDGLDERKPVGNKLSTWLLDKLVGQLKYRAEFLRFPTIITANRNPLLLGDWMAESSTGESSQDTRQAARTIISAFERHCFSSIKFHDLPRNISNSDLTKPERNKRLLSLGKEKNDLKALGFLIAEEYGEEIIW